MAIAADDLALVGGVVACRPVVMLGHQKAAILRTMSPVTLHGFSRGYRKAMRLMEHANRFGMPILTFIDTPASAGISRASGSGSDRLHLREMFRLDVPIICTVIGEGGSGGALGIGVGERLLMFEHAIPLPHLKPVPFLPARLPNRNCPKITAWDLKT